MGNVIECSRLTADRCLLTAIPRSPRRLFIKQAVCYF